ncbi:MAG: hypothetical protein LBL90_12730, partial [Prevotellaceae bacterium]|nr:hypothetical protein [Prevotellaceae bacterium]
MFFPPSTPLSISRRLLNIDRTNALLEDLRTILGNLPVYSKIQGALRDYIIERLEKERQDGFVDWITISVQILFSMRYCTNFDDLRAMP